VTAVGDDATALACFGAQRNLSEGAVNDFAFGDGYITADDISALME
jgi:hypothetical protein